MASLASAGHGAASATETQRLASIAQAVTQAPEVS